MRSGTSMSQPSQILASNEDCTWSHFLLFESSIVEDTSSGVSIFLTSSDFFAGRRSLMTIDNSIFYCPRFWQLFVGDWNSTNPLIAWIQFSPHKSNWHLGKIRARKRLSGHNHLLNLGWSENKEIPDRPGHFLSQKKKQELEIQLRINDFIFCIIYVYVCSFQSNTDGIWKDIYHGNWFWHCHLSRRGRNHSACSGPFIWWNYQKKTGCQTKKWAFTGF